MLFMVLLILTMCVSGYAVAVPETLSATAITAFLSGHNNIRSALGLPDLVWNSKLVSDADKHFSNCTWKPAPRYYGENQYFSSATQTDNAIIANDAIAHWASQVTKVDPNWSCMFVYGGCGGYAQVVWKNTTDVGCSIIHCPSQNDNLVTCFYTPQGNTRGQVPY